MMACPPCDLRNLDYSSVDRGRIVCRACGWGWVFDEDGRPPGWKRRNPEDMP